MLIKLGEAEIKTLDDLADLAGDELVELLGDLAPGLDEANEIIMAARAHWFDDDDAPAAEAAAVAEAAPEAPAQEPQAEA